MSTMQKYRFFYIIILFSVLFCSTGFSQESHVSVLYIQNKISEIETALNAGKITDEDWNKFAQALFVEDLDAALNLYIELYNKTNNIQIKKLVTDRISQYYYAKGLYDSAERLLKDESFRQRIFTANVDKIYFGVQLGAFSSEKNADNARKRFSQNAENLSIVRKTSGGKELFVVIAGQFTSRDEAEKYRNFLKNKYDYNGLVIQF